MNTLLHVINVCNVAYNLLVLLPSVWRYGFDWKLLALIVAAVSASVISSVIMAGGTA